MTTRETIFLRRFSKENSAEFSVSQISKTFSTFNLFFLKRVTFFTLLEHKILYFWFVAVSCENKNETVETILIQESLTSSKPLRWHLPIPSLIYSSSKILRNVEKTFPSFAQVPTQREIQMRQKEEFTFNLNLTCAYLTERNSQMTTWTKKRTYSCKRDSPFLSISYEKTRSTKNKIKLWKKFFLSVLFGNYTTIRKKMAFKSKTNFLYFLKIEF